MKLLILGPGLFPSKGYLWLCDIFILDLEYLVIFEMKLASNLLTTKLASSCQVVDLVDGL
jgi:hypothetical protein